MSGVTTITPQGISAVARKRPKPDEQIQASGRPINFRAPVDLATRLDNVAEKLGLDVSNLVRMILYENLAPYERRARQLGEASADE